MADTRPFHEKPASISGQERRLSERLHKPSHFAFAYLAVGETPLHLFFFQVRLGSDNLPSIHSPTMTPSWKFRDGTKPEHTATPFYIRPWPDDLPAKCGVCGTEFRFGFNLTIGPDKIGRFLKTFAYWMVLPCIPLSFVIVSFFPGFVSGRSGGFGILMLMFFPPAIMVALSKIMPISRLVECKKCGWSHDYKIRRPDPLPPVS